MVFLRASTNTRLGFIVEHKRVFFSLDSAPVFADKVSELKGPRQDVALNHIILRERSSQDSVAFSYGLAIMLVTKLHLTLICNLSGLKSVDIDLIQKGRASYASAG